MEQNLTMCCMSSNALVKLDSGAILVNVTLGILHEEDLNLTNSRLPKHYFTMVIDIDEVLLLQTTCS